jgi:hypothetical protein
MKKLILLFGLILFSTFVFGIDVQPEKDTATISVIQQEHKNTRKFFSDELERQKKDFFNKWDDRANYYENTVDRMLTTTTWKLALLWGGILIMFVSFQSFLKIRMDKAKYDKFKDNVKEEIMKELKIPSPPKTESIKEIPKEKFIYDNKFEVEL